GLLDGGRDRRPPRAGAVPPGADVAGVPTELTVPCRVGRKTHRTVPDPAVGLATHPTTDPWSSSHVSKSSRLPQADLGRRRGLGSERAVLPEPGRGPRPGLRPARRQ